MKEEKVRVIAAKVGIKGFSYRGKDAGDAFFGYYIFVISAEERAKHRTADVRNIAIGWWQSNKQLFPVGNDVE